MYQINTTTTTTTTTARYKDEIELAINDDKPRGFIFKVKSPIPSKVASRLPVPVYYFRKFGDLHTAQHPIHIVSVVS